MYSQGRAKCYEVAVGVGDVNHLAGFRGKAHGRRFGGTKSAEAKGLRELHFFVTMPA